jgi:hypothetical protein
MLNSSSRPLLTQEERDELSEADSDETRVDEGTSLNHGLGDLPDGEASLDDPERDPFRPFDNLPEENRNILTVRAVAVGLICGVLVTASNIYLGLKSGWTASANIFGVWYGCY